MRASSAIYGISEEFLPHRIFKIHLAISVKLIHIVQSSNNKQIIDVHDALKLSGKEKNNSLYN